MTVHAARLAARLPHHDASPGPGRHRQAYSASTPRSTSRPPDTELLVGLEVVALRPLVPGLHEQRACSPAGSSRQRVHARRTCRANRSGDDPTTTAPSTAGARRVVPVGIHAGIHEAVQRAGYEGRSTRSGSDLGTAAELGRAAQPIRAATQRSAAPEQTYTPASKPSGRTSRTAGPMPAGRRTRRSGRARRGRGPRHRLPGLGEPRGVGELVGTEDQEQGRPFTGGSAGRATPERIGRSAHGRRLGIGLLDQDPVGAPCQIAGPGLVGPRRGRTGNPARPRRGPRRRGAARSRRPANQ